MIELISVQKNYGKKKIITEATCTYEKGRIYGLAGYNGSGKTTLLKTIAGIYRPDGGKILADGAPAHKNSDFRRHSFLMTEELFFDPQSSMDDMRKVYRGYYSLWDDDIYDKLLHITGLDRKAGIRGFSKGMQRQAGLILALSTAPEYLFLDETFDGLDFVRRRMLAAILRRFTEKRNACVIVTSHYLNELEKFADSLALIEDGRMIIPDTGGVTLEEYFMAHTEVRADEIDTLF